MALHQSQPRRRGLPFKPLQFGQFNTGHVFEHNQHGVLVDLAGTDLCVAMLTILQDQIVRGNRRPELKVVHRIKPGFDLIDVLESFHGPILPGTGDGLQISGGKRGEP